MKVKHLLIFSSATLIVSFLNTVPFAFPSKAQQFCQCVAYVKNRFGLSGAVGQYDGKGYAMNMGRYLADRGFRQISNPERGAIVIMQNTFPQAHRAAGHVGIIEDIDSDGRLIVRGSNQGSRNQFSEASCSNVTVVRFRTPVNGRSDVSYWVR